MLEKSVTTCMGNCYSPGWRWCCLWWCLFVLSFFPRDVLNEILNLIKSVSEGFPTYSFSWFIPKSFVLLKYADNMIDWLIDCFGFNGPFRQYFSLYRTVSQRQGERKEKIGESKNVQTTPTRTYCKRSRPLPYYQPN